MKTKIKTRSKKYKYSKSHKKNIFFLVLFIVAFIFISSYRSLVVTPSINLADGLDPEEAAFLQKSISKDKTTSTGAAPAPVVKVTVKDKDTGEEYTGKVLLKNIDKPDKVSVEDLTAAITKTVIENNNGIKPSPKSRTETPPLPPTSESCATVASGEWAPTGFEFKPGILQCSICVNGEFDPDRVAVCGQGQAIDYITKPDDNTSAPCWHEGIQYANNHGFIDKGRCQNGKWVELPVPSATPDNNLESTEQSYLTEVRIADELHVTPSIAPVSAPPSQNPLFNPTQDPSDPQSTNTTPSITEQSEYLSSRSSCELGIDKSKEQCVILPGGGYGRVPLVVSSGSDLTCGIFNMDGCGVGNTCKLERSGWSVSWQCQINTNAILSDNTDIESILEDMCNRDKNVWNFELKTCTMPNSPQTSNTSSNIIAPPPKSQPITLADNIDFDSPNDSGALGNTAALVAGVMKECQLGAYPLEGEDLYSCMCNVVDCSDGTSGQQIVNYLSANSVDQQGLQSPEFVSIVIAAIGDGSSPICDVDQAKGLNKSCLPKTESNGWYYCENPTGLYQDDIVVFSGSGAISDPGHAGVCGDGYDSQTCSIADVNYYSDNKAAIHSIAASEVTGVYRKLNDGDPKAKGCWASQTKFVK